jgi:hypothetical protein
LSIDTLIGIFIMLASLRIFDNFPMILLQFANLSGRLSANLDIVCFSFAWAETAGGVILSELPQKCRG